MKNKVLSSLFFAVLLVLMTSCYTYTFNVGEGSRTGVEIVEKNHYVIYGLAPIKTSNPVEMAGGAENYQVTIEHTFVDGLLSAITFGLYTPTTTRVRR